MQILVIHLQMQNFVPMRISHSSKKCYKIFRMLSKPNFFSWLNESKFRVYITILQMLVVSTILFSIKNVRKSIVEFVSKQAFGADLITQSALV